jgi:hypothetical protein
MPGFTYWFHTTFPPFISQHYFSLVSHQIRFYFIFPITFIFVKLDIVIKYADNTPNSAIF